MKLIYNRSFLFVLCLFIGWNLTAQTTGGPDAYGYTWIDSNDPSGEVALNFIDIREDPNSTQVEGLQDDNAAAGFIDMGINFHFYWLDYSAVKLGSNGWISFANVGNISSCFPAIPTQAASGQANNLVCPMMTDLNFGDTDNGNPAEMWYTTIGTQFIVSYYDVPFWQAGTPTFNGDNTFQVIFDSADSSIMFQYLEMDAAATGNCAAPFVNSAVGIENVSGNIGLSLVESGGMPPSNYAVKFFYPQTVTFEVADVTPEWNQNDRNGGSFYLPGSEVPVSASISNGGNSDVAAPFSAKAEVFKAPIAFPEYTSSAMVEAIPLGGSAEVDFDPFTELTFNGGGPITPGTYSLEVTTELGGDLLPDNNSNITELVVVDNTTEELMLTYGSPTVDPIGSIQWTNGGGNSGMGVYYEPPFYPFTINAVSVFALGDGVDDAYTIQVYSDQTMIDGIPDPAALISLADVQAGSYTNGSWVRSDLPAPLVINSGGFYVAWVMQGNECAIGTEESLPVSRRSLEFIGGGWAEFRQNKTDDVSMRIHGDQLNTSIEEAVFTSNVNLFPNPTHDKINIQSTLTDVAIERVQLFNTLGEKMLDNRVNIEPNQVHTLNLSAMAGGVYYMSLTADGSTITKKVSLIK